MKPIYTSKIGIYAVVILFLSILCLSCSPRSKNPLESKKNGIYVFDFDKAKTKPDFLYSSIYKRVSVIPLETNQFSLIGSISKIRVFDNYIFVLDSYDAKTLFLFDREGNFIRKIGNNGQGPREYIEPSDFTIDIEGKTVYVLDDTKQRILRYDLTTGSFIKAIDLEEEVRNIEYFDGKLYADANFRQNTDNNYLLRVIDESSGKEQSRYLNVRAFSQGISNTSRVQKNLFHFRENGNPVFVRQFMSHVVGIDRDSIFSLIELKGKDFFLTSDEVDEIKSASLIRNSSEVISRINKYHSIGGFIEKGDLILMDFEKGFSLQKLLIHKKKNEMYVLEPFNDDVLFKIDVPYPIPTYSCYDKGGVYYYVNTHSMSEYQTFAKEGVLSSDLVRLEDLKNLEEDANPFIFYYEFKD